MYRCMLFWVVFDRSRLCYLGLDVFSVVHDVQQVSIVSNGFSWFRFCCFLSLKF